jgi:hypothetical protein
MRSVHGTFPEYHTSADNLDFVRPEALRQSYTVGAALFDVLENNRLYKRVDGRGEPQLGRRGLYRAIAGQREAGGATQMDLLWLLNLADGHHSLDMAIRADIPFARCRLPLGWRWRLARERPWGSFAVALGFCTVKSVAGSQISDRWMGKFPKRPVLSVGRTDLKKILYFSSQTGSRVELVEMAAPPVVWKILLRHRTLLITPPEELSQMKLAQPVEL